MWKKTEAGALYGKQLDNITAAAGDDTSVGTVALSFTSGIHFNLKDLEGVLIPDFVNTCDIIFEGYEGKIEVYKDGARLSSTYMPQATYKVNITCENYKPRSYTFDFPTSLPTGLGAWETIDILMEGS